MIRTSSIYEACHELFADYPLAVRTASHAQAVRSMVLTVPEGDTAGFFVLSHDRLDDRACFTLRRWRTAEIMKIEADGGAVSDVVVNAMTHGVPIPRHGSLFGWRCEDTVTSLLGVYTRYAPEYPEPSWTVMPLAGSWETQWPPFTDEHPFGRWFWEDYWAGAIVCLGGLIASTPDTIFWIETQAILGCNCCVVARDVRSPEGYTVRRGLYVYHQVLRESKPVPSLEMLLADVGKTDLSPRFQRSSCGD
jgi:hypothetical protein